MAGSDDGEGDAIKFHGHSGGAVSVLRVGVTNVNVPFVGTDIHIASNFGEGADGGIELGGVVWGDGPVYYPYSKSDFGLGAVKRVGGSYGEASKVLLEILGGLVPGLTSRVWVWASRGGRFGGGLPTPSGTGPLPHAGVWLGGGPLIAVVELLGTSSYWLDN